MHVAARTHSEREWLVRYPSLSRNHGQELRLEGELVIAWIDNACSPAIATSRDEVVVLDPRAVITALDSGEVFYGPSSVAAYHSAEMAGWIAEHPEWEEEFAPGGAPKIPLAIPQSDVYVAPRVGTRPAEGRQVRTAACGHDVYLSEQGIDAVDRRGKRLMCGPCQEAWAAEQGGELRVTDSPL